MICLKSDPHSAHLAAEYLRSGKVVILPTDTVYGFSGIANISSDGTTLDTAERIRAIKGRSEDKPFICLIAKALDISLYTDDDIPKNLLENWPGALTIIVNNKFKSGVTTAFRCPGSAWLRDVIAECGSPIYSSSVNRSGQATLDTIESIQREFERDVDLIVSDGGMKGALPSTVVKIENGRIKVLRQGAIKLKN